MRIDITSGDVKVIIDRGMDESMVDFAVLEYTNSSEPGTEPPYTLNATATNVDELRLLLEAAEADGSEVRKRAENLLTRVDDLFQSWQAAINRARK